MQHHDVTLYHADCLQFLPTIATNSVDLIITDPPYSSGGLHSGTRRQPPSSKYLGSDVKRQVHDFPHDNKDQRSWLRWCCEWLAECYRVLKPGQVIAVFIDWRQLPTLTDAMQMAGFLWQGVAVWDKTIGGCRPRKGGMRQQAEFIVWASKGRLDQYEIYLPGVFHGRKPTDTFHITAKPVPLLVELCELAGPGGHVLDPFAGGAATMIAAMQAGKSATGCELEPAIYQQAQQAIAKARQQVA